LSHWQVAVPRNLFTTGAKAAGTTVDRKKYREMEMNQRDFVRYDTVKLPPVLRKVTVTWQEGSPTAAYGANYSAHGINVVIPPLPQGALPPSEHDPVEVLLPVDENWYSGQCVHVRKEADGSICLGIHFDHPGEHDRLQKLLFNSLQRSSQVHPSFISYEWEELVARLCDSEDPELKEIGYRHRDTIREKQAELAVW